MNSENPSQNTLPEEKNTVSANIKKPQRKMLLIAVAILIVVLLCAGLATKDVISERIQKQKLMNNYENLQAEYNTAVETYNTDAQKYNNLLSVLKEYSTNLPDEITDLPIELGDNFDEYIVDDPDLSKLAQSVQDMQAKAASLEADTKETGLAVVNSAIDDYNLLADAYNKIITETSLDFIEDMLTEALPKASYTNLDEITPECDLGVITDNLESLRNETEIVAAYYIIAQQITNPSEEFVIDRLSTVADITGIQAVTADKDPNGLLGKEGGYTACIYFTIDAAEPDTVNGEDIVDKGTDAGGAVEVYDTLEHALNRCDYLSQFDNTLLYSGSYAIIGTMVIRTSYRLDNNAQCDLTDQITQAFTRIE